MALFNLGIILITAAALMVLLARFLRMPSIVAYLVAGLILGPGSGLVQPSPIVHDLSEIGIMLLLFVVGLELSIDKIRAVGKVAVLAGLGQVVFTGLGGLVICWLLGYSWIESIFLATALTFSSTVVVVKLLDQKRELDQLYGRIAVGIFLVQDMVVIVVLTLLSGLGVGAAEAATPGRIALEIGKAFAASLGVLAMAIASSRWLLPPLFRWIATAPGAMLIWSLCWCFLFVSAAQALGISAEIGAFLAGLSLAQCPVSHDLQRRVHPLMSFFISVFFVSLGIEMELGQAASAWGPSLVLSLFVLIGNPLIFILIIVWCGYSRRISVITGLTVAQISEFSFIFVATGLESGLVDRSVMSVTAMVGLVTISLSAYLIIYNHQIYRWMRYWSWWRFLPDHPEDSQPESGPHRSGHVVVVGMNELGRLVVHALHSEGLPVLAIDTDPGKLTGLPCDTLHGNVDYPSVLDAANVGDARAAVCVSQIESVNQLFAYRCKRLGVPVAVHGFDSSVLASLRDAGADFVLDSKAYGLRAMEDKLRSLGVLPA